MHQLHAVRPHLPRRHRRELLRAHGRRLRLNRHDPVERVAQVHRLRLVRCVYCGDCVEVCPHGALGETPNFELSTYGRFGRTVLAKEELAVARTWKPSEDIPTNGDGKGGVRPPEVRPPAPPRWSA